MTLEREICERWKSRQVPLTDAILFADGRIEILRSFAVADGSSVSTGVQRVAQTTLDSVLANDPDPWFEAEPLCSCEDETRNIRFLAGGGDMGNEGFIAAETRTDGQLLWVGFFDRSNPFDDIRADETTVRATNNHDEDWVVPLDDPGSVWVERV